LVLLDWQMPRMNGEETCRAIRAISHVPVIVVSAMDRTTEARPYGVSRSLIKPVDIDALLDGIAFALMEPNR
jgi:DNA-binding response OmpR family regulator